MIERRRFLVVASIGAVSAPLGATAQQGAMKRLGILSIGSPSTAADMAKTPFGVRLRELGWVEGSNLSVERRFGKGPVDELVTMAHDLVRSKVDVIFAASAAPAAAAKRATSTVPIVFLTLGDPVDQGLIASFAQPGKNITGVAGPQTAGKRLEMLAELVPNISRVGALVNSTNPATPGIVRQMEQAARARQIEIKAFAVETAGDLDRAWSAIIGYRAHGVVVADDALLFRVRAEIRDRAARMKLPVVYGHREDALEGGLAAFSTLLAEQFNRAATYVDRILRGTDPGRLPVERAERFETIINVKTAKALGLTIPPSVLARADQVIE